MVFNIFITLTNIESGNKKYSLAIGDTIIVDTNKSIICTKLCKRQLGNISVRVDESSSEDELEVEAQDNEISFIRESRDKRTVPQREISEDLLLKRKLHQSELGKKLHENSMKRYLKQDGSSKSDILFENQSNNLQKFKCYSLINELPKERDIFEMKIYVDKIHDCVLLPILGMSVPFHISTIKNINTSLESDYMYLRINFVQPISWYF